MTQRVAILIGTMTGTAEMVAEEVAETLKGRGIDSELKMMEDLDPAVFHGGDVFLICTSTYGQGDIPDNARDFFAAIEAAQPDLSDVRYGVIGLGDSTYSQTFCFGGKRFDALLEKLGAQRVGELLLHDAADGSLPEEEAVGWAEGWAEHLPQACEAAA